MANVRLGAQALVWHWYTLRPLWILGACGRGLLAGHAHGAYVRKGK